MSIFIDSILATEAGRVLVAAGVPAHLASLETLSLEQLERMLLMLSRPDRERLERLCLRLVSAIGELDDG